jgi:hypothetical protein
MFNRRAASVTAAAVGVSPSPMAPIYKRASVIRLSRVTVKLNDPDELKRISPYFYGNRLVY